MGLLYLADLKIGGGEIQAKPGAAGEGIVGGEAVAEQGGLGDADGAESNEVSAEATVVVGRQNFMYMVGYLLRRRSIGAVRA